jgi:hypothetical protein
MVFWGYRKRKNGKTMDTQEKFEYWQDIAQYDLDTAQAMLEETREAFTWLGKLKP